ncbi:MAG: tRNA pseudouridine synthase A, partial [Aquificaceae bacterium]
DAGVHALEYVANFQAQKLIEPEKILKALNSLLPEDVGLKRVWLQEDFNARFGVKGKLYLYRIMNTNARDPFLEPFSWRLPYRLDYERMRLVSELFLGIHDFSGFASVEGEKNTFIKVEDVSLRREGELIEFRVRARSFLRYMVRRMVGCLLHVGLHRLNPEDVKDYLEGRGRCPYTAKAKGLTLEKVFF